MTEFKKGDDVTWSWGKGKAEGEVAETFTDKVTKTIHGKKVTRNADEDKPAYLVKQEDGGKALKSETELDKA